MTRLQITMRMITGILLLVFIVTDSSLFANLTLISFILVSLVDYQTEKKWYSLLTAGIFMIALLILWIF